MQEMTSLHGNVNIPTKFGACIKNRSILWVSRRTTLRFLAGN